MDRSEKMFVPELNESARRTVAHHGVAQTGRVAVEGHVPLWQANRRGESANFPLNWGQHNGGVAATLRPAGRRREAGPSWPVELWKNLSPLFCEDYALVFSWMLYQTQRSKHVISDSSDIYRSARGIP